MVLQLPPGEICYLLGIGGRIGVGLDEELFRHVFALTGWEKQGTFKKLRCEEQCKVIKQDSKEQFWTLGSRVIANSFGDVCFLVHNLGLRN